MRNKPPSFEAQVALGAGGGGTVPSPNRIVFRHHRAPEVAWSVDTASGGHVLHLALAQCVFNNVLRIGQERGLTITELRVVADGGFNADATASTGVECAVDLTGAADESTLSGIARDAFDESSVVAILRRGGPVELASVTVTSSSNLGDPAG